MCDKFTKKGVGTCSKKGPFIWGQHMSEWQVYYSLVIVISIAILTLIAIIIVIVMWMKKVTTTREQRLSWQEMGRRFIAGRQVWKK